MDYFAAFFFAAFVVLAVVEIVAGRHPGFNLNLYSGRPVERRHRKPSVQR